MVFFFDMILKGVWLSDISRRYLQLLLNEVSGIFTAYLCKLHLYVSTKETGARELDCLQLGTREDGTLLILIQHPHKAFWLRHPYSLPRLHTEQKGKFIVASLLALINRTRRLPPLLKTPLSPSGRRKMMRVCSSLAKLRRDLMDLCLQGCSMVRYWICVRWGWTGSWVWTNSKWAPQSIYLSTPIIYLESIFFPRIDTRT